MHYILHSRSELADLLLSRLEGVEANIHGSLKLETMNVVPLKR